MEGKTQETAAAMAGMSVRSARKWQRGPLPSETKQERRWCTRPDPFEGVWEEEIEPLLRGDPAGKLKATTIIECPSTSSGGGTTPRPVQRLPATRSATAITRLAGAQRPRPGGLLPPGASPGREAQIDFTHGNSLGVTIAGRLFPHLLFHLILKPLGLVLRRGGCRRDLPGATAGTTSRTMDSGRRPSGGAQRQYLGRYPRDAPQPRTGPE